MRFIPIRFFIESAWKNPNAYEEVNELKDFDNQFTTIINKHISILGLWCFTHLIVGIIGWIFGNELWKFFSIMSISWAVVNFGVVLFFYNHVSNQKFKAQAVFQRFEVQKHVEKILFANMGLDVAYLFCGLFFLAISNQENINRPLLWKGFALAIMVQAVYLFFQDLYFSRLHKKNFKKATPYFEEIIESQLQKVL